MKKLIYTLAVFFTVLLSSNAQEKRLDPKEVARTDAKELAQLVNLDATQTENFARLFEMKYNTLSINNLSDERKAELSRIMELKIRATLDAKQMEILDKNKEFLTRLIK